MTGNWVDRGSRARVRAILAAILLCSAVVLGVVAPAMAVEPMYTDVVGVGCNDVVDTIKHPVSVSRIDFGIDPGTARMMANAQGISNPADVAITPDGRYVIVSGPHGVYISDISGTFSSSPVVSMTGAEQIAVSPDGTIAVVGSSSTNLVKVLALSASGVVGTLTSLPIAPARDSFTGTNYVYAVGVTPDSRQIVVGAYDGYTHVIDLATLAEVQAIDLGTGFSPAALAVDPSGRSIVITSFTGENVAVLEKSRETGEFALRACVSVGTGSGTEPAITRDGHFALVANGLASTLAKIDLLAEPPTVVGTKTVGSNPQGAAIVDDYGEALVTNKGSGTISVIDIGDLTVTATLQPTVSDTTTKEATTSVHRFAIWRPNRAPTAEAGPDQEVSPGSTVQLGGSGSSDPDRDHYLTYAWTVTKPDGNSVVLDGVSPVLVADQEGTYAVELTVTDPLGVTATDSMTVTATPSNTPPMLGSIGNSEIDEGQTLTFTVSASDDETPDGLTFAATPLPPGATFDGATFTWTTVDGDAGTYTVRFTVTDAGGMTDDETVTITVNDQAFDLAPPAIGVLTAHPNPVAVNMPVDLAATIDDSGTGGSPIAWAACSVDGGPVVPMVASDGAFDQATETVTTSLTGLSAGVHSVTLSAADAKGNEATTPTPLLIVVYDPNSGFVTGGGWISSPPGAYPAGPALTGKATFGFVSKYQKGTGDLKGEAEFAFKTADLRFRADTYEWLVVTGTAADLKGTGTLNGMSGYDLTLTAVDNGKDDAVRFCITDPSGTVVYDTKDEIPLAGGSIVIHRSK